jgi:penicillin-binding protein 2
MALASGGQRHTGMQQQPAILLGLVVLFASAMVLRLGWLQLLHGEENRARADENRIRLLARNPVRGRILDRNGQVLVSSRLTYSLYLQPKLVSDQAWPALRARLSQLMGMPEAQLDQKRRDGPGAQRYRIELASELTPQQVLRFREQSTGLKGAEVDLDVLRSYPHGSLAAHALGYTQPITEQEYKSLAKKGYQIRDRIGRIGLEAAFESHLRGAWGGQMVEVNAMGEIQRILGDRPSKAGKDLQTTLDLDLQRAAEQVLKDKPGGAIVALNPANGAILALASRPTFDPNFFSKSVTTQKEYDALFNSPVKPLLSRAMSAYDPGSTWKAVTAMAGMESGKFPPNTKLVTRGCITYGGHCFPDHNGAGFGTIGYEESPGLVGNERWAAQGRGWSKPGSTPWIPEDMASMSIGQSVVQITPLQLARAYAVFANGGYLITPHLVDQGLDWTDPPRRTKVAIKPSTLATIARGLRKVVQEGTGHGMNVPNLPPVAGKTGTAEDSTGGPDHAWFACFAPYPNGQIVVVAFAQNTPGGGSVHALPMARKVLEVWTQLRKS